MTTFLALNLRHGGATRIDGLLKYILSVDADYTICSEFRQNPPGKRLIAEMQRAGRSAHVAPVTSPGQNSVAIFVRGEAAAFALCPPPDNRQRIVACEGPDGIVVAGVYFANGKEKAPLFNYLLNKPFADRAVVVLGDFNTGLHRRDEEGATFACADLFEQLGTTGLSDLWRHSNGEEARDYTWFSRTSRGFRIDHAFGSNPVLKRVGTCRYDHSTRAELTDHSALHLTLHHA